MGREKTLSSFMEIIPSKLDLNISLEVGLVGGSDADPELGVLKEQFDFSISYLGIEEIVGECFYYLDLNIQNRSIEKRFDLLICSQVFEHLWDLGEAYKNLHFLLKPGGLLWVACPASNFVHGSPEYFSAGYPPQLLENMGKKYGFTVLASGFSGSQREYYSRHLLQMWFSKSELKRIAFIRFGAPGSTLKKILFNFVTLGKRFILMFTPDRESHDLKFACESWALLKKST